MDPLYLFGPSIKKWFEEQIGSPTEIQQKSWPLIAGGRHILMSAPTGTGKTLAAFLWAINQLLTGVWPKGETSVLYVSPMRALNNDIRKNLLIPIEQIGADIGVFVRSGDTPPDERRRMFKRPPEILITTPESLNILLTSKNSCFIFKSLKTVIMDEIHAIAGNKRGTLLISSVERLTRISGEFQRIILSATIRPIELVADWAGGKRDIQIVEASRSKKYEIKVEFPAYSPGMINDKSIWPSLIEEFKRLIKNRKSTLIFANSRRQTEKIARLMNENETEILAYSHHGSISRELRLEVEDKLKKGELRSIVATSSLELGIDIGELDQVILVDSPRSVSSALQRIGRAGHKVGFISRGVLYPTHDRDFIDAAVMARAVEDYEIEPLKPVENPLDILSQIILSMITTEDWDIVSLYDFIRTIYPYRNLPYNHYLLVLNILSGRYAGSRIKELKPRISIDNLKKIASALDGSASLVYLSGGAIPDRGYYNLRVQDTNSKIGELDEEFVWERKIGDTFSLGPSVWKIRNITNNDVIVIPAGGEPKIIPFWKAEDSDRGFFFFEKVGLFLEKASSMVDNEKAFINLLISEYSMSESAAWKLTDFLKSQVKFTKSPLPSRSLIIAEHIKDQSSGDYSGIVLHTFWGGRVNRPFSFILSSAWQNKYGNPIEVMSGDDNILIMLPPEFKLSDVLELLYASDLEGLLKESIENTGYFGAHFRENAGRALLLPKNWFNSRVPLWLNRLRSKKLLEAVSPYKDFPITIETWRECLQDSFELENLKKLIEEIRTGEIKISEIYTPWPSPFCGNIIWHQKNKYVYEDDTPIPSETSRLSGDIFREMLASGGLRPLIPADTISLLDQKLKRTYPGYAPQNYKDLLEWLKDRLLIGELEWKELTELTGWYDNAGNDIISIKPPLSKFRLVCATEYLPLVSSFYELSPEELDISPMNQDVSIEGYIKNNYKKLSSELSESALLDRGRFFLQWISYYPVIDTEIIPGLIGLSKADLAEILEELSKSGEIIIDKLIEGSEGIFVAERSNLEYLLRTLRKKRSPVFKALPKDFLQLFLANHLGLTGKNSSIDSFKTDLEKLFGYPLKASIWEELIFPSRFAHYFPAWLDSLLQNTELLWFGCGKQKVSFAFPEDIELFFGPRGPIEFLEFPDIKRWYSFFELAEIMKTTSEKAAGKIWNMAWKGLISNDSFEPVRKGILNNFTASGIKEQAGIGRRGHRSRWESSRPLSGKWYALQVTRTGRDLLGMAEIQKSRARILFDRYGIIFREILNNEEPEFRWGSLIRTFRLMELSGEILSGYFFEGIPGPQFASQEAYRELLVNLPNDRIYWLSAADPASLCGTGIEGISSRYPKRSSSNLMVFHGERLVLIISRSGKHLEFLVGPDHAMIEKYLDIIKVLLTREFNPYSSLRVERINGIAANESPYRGVLINFGFKSSYKGLEIWRY